VCGTKRRPSGIATNPLIEFNEIHCSALEAQNSAIEFWRKNGFLIELPYGQPLAKIQRLPSAGPRLQPLQGILQALPATQIIEPIALMHLQTRCFCYTSAK
jgi:hypothetical protein